MFSRLRFLKAYRSVLVVLGSYLFLAFQKRLWGATLTQEKTRLVHRKNAQRIEKTILELKGLFIKMGQMLSIMSNFLPEDLTRGLEGLQDCVPPHPYPEIRKRFFEEFKKYPEDLFARFEEKPIASASLGQVHVAFLQDGTKVAVKVQYPEIDRIVKSDLKTLKRIFGLLHLFFPAYGLRYVYREIASVVMQELHYPSEAKNLELLKKNFSAESHFRFPDVFWDYSGEKILTLQFMEGVKASSVADLTRSGIPLSEVATRIIHGYCKQIFIDGVYHADPHPGNLLVQKGANPEDFKIVLVDFGATARVSPKMRQGMTLFVEGIIKRDTKVLAQAMREMGFVAREGQFEPFEELVDYFYGKLSQIKVEDFRKIDLSELHNLDELLELRKIKISFRDLMTSFHVPKDWLLLERTLLLILGLCSVLDPKLNPVDIVVPYVESFVLQDKSFRQVALDLSKQLVLSYIQLPHEIQKTLRRLNEGSLSFQLKGLADHSQKIGVIGRQILYAFLSLGGLFFSLQADQAGYGDYSIYSLYGAGFFGVALFTSLLKNRL